MPLFIPQYDSLRIHDLMLSDDVRTGAYREAIEANVSDGDVVLDVGTGTGILALLAAKAGARKVYAVEPTGIIELARRIAETNRLGSRIELIRARAEEVELPEQVDCIVSEWIGVFGVQENMLPSVARARDRFLKPGGKMLPEKVLLYLSLVEDADRHEDKVGRWTKRPHELDYSDFAHCQANDVHASLFEPESLLSLPALLIELDMVRASTSAFSVDSRLTATREGTCHGLGGWFQAEFPGGIVLDTGPGELPTHWNHSFFPLAEPVAVRAGEDVNVAFAAEVDRADDQIVHFIWEVSFPGSGRSSLAGDTRKVKFNG